MKKSKIIAIGLVTLSVASCTQKKDKKHQDLESYNKSTNYYVNDGTGYHRGGISPFWIYMAYRVGQNGHVTSQPGYVYRGHSGSYHSTSFGSRSSMSRGSVSRGGFGFSGAHASS